MSRGFDGFEINDFRDSGWERDSRASNRESSQGRGGNSATERSTARKLERLREAEHSLDILNRLSQERSNQIFVRPCEHPQGSGFHPLALRPTLHALLLQGTQSNR